MTLVERSSVVEKIREILSNFISQRMLKDFNYVLWCRSMMSKHGLGEDFSAENFSDYTFLGSHLTVDHIDPYLIDIDERTWNAKINLVISVDAGRNQFQIKVGAEGRTLLFLNFMDEYDGLSEFGDDQIDDIRKIIQIRFQYLSDLFN